MAIYAKRLGKLLLLASAVSVVFVTHVVGSSISGVVGIDFEESPTPDLREISNVYLGSSRYVYAFLVVKSWGEGDVAGLVSGYDLGYRLISGDQSIINHGFYRLEGWQALPLGGHDFPDGVGSSGLRLPAAIGYWKLELTKGLMSRGELQIGPYPYGTREAVTFVGGGGTEIALPNQELSQDTECHGMINQTYYEHRVLTIGSSGYVPGQIIARFMPGVVDMETRAGAVGNLADPGLKRIAEDNRLVRVRRIFTDAQRDPEPILSRTGEIVTPLDMWDVYLLEFPREVDLDRVLNAILSLPRCVYAEPNGLGELTAIHTPNDSLASASWHIDRIKMPEAWDIQVGNGSVRVGVVDDGVDYDLYDLGGGFGSGYKIAGGWDYSDGGDADPRCVSCGHGNWMTSTIGAITNNNSGVVGIAGGWGGYAGELGPSIYHFKVQQDTGTYHPFATYADAVNNAYPRYGCGVVTVSASFYAGRDLPDFETFKEALYNCHEYGVVVVSNFDNHESAACNWPACYRDDWVVCLQGTNEHPTSPTDTIPERRASTLDGYNWGSDWPFDAWPVPALCPDVSAPATKIWVVDTATRPYIRGGGNSYATQIAGGVIALMLAEKPMMQVCDVEGLLCASCTDVTTDARVPGESLPGWDKYSGWGRINADSCLKLVSSPCAPAIQHFIVEGGGVVTDSTTVPDTVEFGGAGPLSGSFVVRRFEVRREITRPASGWHFVWGVPCVGAGWEWSGSGQAYPYDNYNLQAPYCKFIQSTIDSSWTLLSYTYKVWGPRGTWLGWYPAPPNMLNWGYAVLWDTLAASVDLGDVIDRTWKPEIVSAAPNPMLREVAITFRMPNPGQVSIKIYDVRGREVKCLTDEYLGIGTCTRKWDGTDNTGRGVAPGVYSIRLAGSRDVDVRKVLFLR